MNRKKIFKVIIEGVQLFDVFGVPISFNFDGQEIYKSFIGGLSTIIVTFLIVISFQSQIRNFSNKETIYFDIGSNFNSNPQELQLNSENFMFAIRVEQSNAQIFNQHPYFNIILNQANYTTINGTTVRSQKQLDFEPCTIEKFSKFDAKIAEAFTENSLNEYICPTNETTLYLQGAFLNTEFNFAKIQIQICQGFTNQAKWNVSCASQNDIDAYLKSNGQFRVALYALNSVINPTVATEYSEIYLSEDLNFLFQPGYMKQTVNVYFQEYVVNTDESLFIDKDIKTEKFIFRNENNYKLENVIDISNTNVNSAPLTIYFRSDFFSQSANRRFQKIDQLFAYFGGIFNVFLIVFGIFLKYYNSTFYKLKMANRLYQYTDLNPHIQGKTAPDYNYNHKLMDLEKGNDRTFLRLNNYKNKIEYLYHCFKNFIIKSDKVYPQLEYLLYMITCKKKFRTTRNLLVDKSISQIETDSNVRVLIKKVQEIERIKLIFLDDIQLKFFNFMQRPIISLYSPQSSFDGSIRNKADLSKSKIKEKKLENFTELLKAYKLLNEKYKDSIISQRLLGSLGDAMQQLLIFSIQDNSEEMTKNEKLDIQMIKCESIQQQPH